MHYDNGKISDLKIAYIGGGSRLWAWSLMTDLAMEEKLSGSVRLYDIDFAAAKNNEIIGNRVSELRESRGKFQYEAVDSLKRALTGCDFVVISILPGTFDEMEIDVSAPEKYGVFQSVGDTTGPGGAIRALRAIPMYIPIAESIRDCCPDAWVINYTNPMALCVKTLYTVFPQIKAFGCCHEVFGTQKVLLGIAKKELGDAIADETDWHEVHVNVMGLNHFTWFDRASLGGIDLFPVYRSYIDKNFESGYEETTDNWMNNCFSCAHRVKMDLFKRYGMIAAAGDRHLAEFMPSNIYLNDKDTIASWKFSLTPVSWRKEDLKKRIERSLRLSDGSEKFELKHTGEEGALLIKALCGLGAVISNVNLPNTLGQISNFPRTTVVETNALFDFNLVHPLQSGKVPDNILSLMEPHIENQETIMRAALLCDEMSVVEAFRRDPLIKGKRLSHGDIRNLVREMIDGEMKYLPKSWSKH